MEKRWKAYCPMMRGMCVDGHVKVMGQDQDGMPIKCAFITKLVGKDPQSEKEYDDWRCAIAWMPIMMVENAQMSRQTAASVDKVANETAGVKGAMGILNRSFIKAAHVALEMREQRLLDAAHERETKGEIPCGEPLPPPPRQP